MEYLTSAQQAALAQGMQRRSLAYVRNLAARLTAMPAGGMCNYTVKVSDAAEVDDQLIEWIRTAYQQAG